MKIFYTSSENKRKKIILLSITFGSQIFFAAFASKILKIIVKRDFM